MEPLAERWTRYAAEILSNMDQCVDDKFWKERHGYENADKSAALYYYQFRPFYLEFVKRLDTLLAPGSLTEEKANALGWFSWHTARYANMRRLVGARWFKNNDEARLVVFNIALATLKVKRFAEYCMNVVPDGTEYYPELEPDMQTFRVLVSTWPRHEI